MFCPLYIYARTKYFVINYINFAKKFLTCKTNSIELKTYHNVLSLQRYELEKTANIF